MSLRPIRNRVIIRPDPPKTHIGLIIIPNSVENKDPLQTGVVLAMGPGMPMKNGNRWPMPDIQIGQRVFYRTAGCVKTKLDDVEHHVVYDEQLAAVVDEEVAVNFDDPGRRGAENGAPLGLDVPDA